MAVDELEKQNALDQSRPRLRSNRTVVLNTDPWGTPDDKKTAADREKAFRQTVHQIKADLAEDEKRAAAAKAAQAAAEEAKTRRLQDACELREKLDPVAQRLVEGLS